MNELIWTKETKDCPNKQFSITDEGFEIRIAYDLLASNEDRECVSLGVSLRVVRPVVLMFEQVDYFNEVKLLTNWIVVKPEIVGRELFLEFIGNHKDIVTIPSGTQLVNMLVLDLNYSNLFEVSNKQFGDL